METFTMIVDPVVQTCIDFLKGTPLPFLFSYAVLLMVAYQVIRISLTLVFVYFSMQRTIKKVASKYQRFRLSGNRRILIVGDSTAVGTGAKFPGNTIAGMLGQDYPDAHIFNAAKNGAMTDDVLDQLKDHDGLYYDAVIISSGGNDVWSLVTVKSIGKSLAAVIEKSRAISSGRVVIVFFGNIGSAPIFPRIIRYFLMRRERKILKVFKDVCSRTNTHLIQLFIGDAENPFVEHPEIYFSADRLHPNDNGYTLWYRHILRYLQENGFLREHH